MKRTISLAKVNIDDIPKITNLLEKLRLINSFKHQLANKSFKPNSCFIGSDSMFASIHFQGSDYELLITLFKCMRQSIFVELRKLNVDIVYTEDKK